MMRDFIGAVLSGGPRWWPISLLGDILLAGMLFEGIRLGHYDIIPLVAAIVGLVFLLSWNRDRYEADLLKKRQPR